MDILSAIWGSLSFVGALYLAVFMTAYKLQKKPFCYPKALLHFFLICIIAHFYNRAFIQHGIDSVELVFLQSLICLFLFSSITITIKLSFYCTFWEALFCSNAGYCLEHISQRLALLLSEIFLPDSSVISRAVLLVLVTTILYYITFKWIIKNKYYTRIIADSKLQIVISILVLYVTIILSSTAGYLAEQLDSPLLEYHVYVYSIISATLALFIEFILLFQKNTEYERNILEHLMHENENQFHLEQNAIDVINVKCHDLKHQFHQLQQKVASEELEEIQGAVNAYDFIFHTGNTALDTILTMKSLQCETKKIIFTCMGSGSFLSFLSNSDIYSLFGNILDNAIEAVEVLENSDQRIIGLTITNQADFIYIHSENYYQGNITYKNGIPQTHKEDNTYHGFGVHSIQLITEKYHGSCKFTDQYHVFMIDIVFPITYMK